MATFVNYVYALEIT